MRSRLVLVPVALVALALGGVSPPDARAGVTVELRGGNSVKGTLEAGGEEELYLVRIPEGAVLTVKLKRLKKGTTPSFTLTDDEDRSIADGQIVENAGGAQLKKFLVPKTDRFKLRVFARDGESAGDYALKVSWKSPKKFAADPVAEPTGGSVTFVGDAESLMTFKLKPGKGSGVIPKVTRIEGPRGYVENFGATPGKAPVAALKKFELPFTGNYELFYGNDADVGGAVKGKLTVKQAKSRAKVDVTAKAIETENGDSAAVAQIVSDAGATITVADLAGGDEDFDSILGTSIEIPGGALPSATPIVVATSDDVVPRPPRNNVATEGGPAVFFGPAGTRFAEPVTITIPISADAANAPDDVVVFTQRGNGRATVVDDVTVNTGDQTASFPVSHFSSFQAFIVEPAPTGGGGGAFNLNATLEVYFDGAAARFASYLAAYPPNGFLGNPGAGFLVSTLPSAPGLFAVTDPPFAPGGVSVDSLAVAGFLEGLAYSPTSGNIYMVDGRQIFVSQAESVRAYAGTGSAGSTGDGANAVDATFDDISAVEAASGGLIVADDDRIRFIQDLGQTSGQINALYGIDGGDTADGVTPATAGFDEIKDLVLSGGSGEELFVAEAGRIRRFGGTANSNVTVVGSNQNDSGLIDGARDEALLDARFQDINAIAYDDGRNVIYIVDGATSRAIYAADLDNGVVRLIAGTPGVDGTSAPGTAAPGQIRIVTDIAVVGGLIVFTETSNNRVLYLDFATGNPF